MPKILRIINRFNLGGPTYNVAYLTKFLSHKYQTVLVGGNIDKTEESSKFILNQLNLTAIDIPEMKREISFLNDYKAYKKIRNLIQQHKPDIVHTHASKAGTLGRLAAIHEKVPIIIHTFHGHVFHSYFGKLKTLFYKSVERFLAHKTTKIIAISNQQKFELTHIHKIAAPQKFEVIPLGFDLNKFYQNRLENRNSFRAKFQLAPNQVAIGIIGRLVPIKNHWLFLQCLKFISQNTQTPIKAFIIGNGELFAQIKNCCNQLNLSYNAPNETNFEKTIQFTSWIENIEWACAGLDIVMLTSLNEGTPVSLIEAQAAGKPVIATKVGGVQDVMEHEKSGYCFPINQTTALFNAALNLVNQKQLRDSMGKFGEKLVKEKFHYSRLVADMEHLYENLLNHK